MDSNSIWYFALGFLLGIITGAAGITLILSAVMLSSRISAEEEQDGAQ